MRFQSECACCLRFSLSIRSDESGEKLMKNALTPLFRPDIINVTLYFLTMILKRLTLKQAVTRIVRVFSFSESPGCCEPGKESEVLLTSEPFC